jgi:acyl carrier protein
LEQALNIQNEVLEILDEVLSLKGRAKSFSDQTVLLGALPELDSMAVLGVITSFEDRFGFTVEDDDIDGSTFATVGTLVAYVSSKLKH